MMCSGDSKDKAADASELLKQMDLLDLVEGAKHGGPKFLIQFTCDADKSICSQENESDRRSTKVISKTAYEKGTYILPFSLLIIIRYTSIFQILSQVSF
jgi:hypothetical protein